MFCSCEGLPTAFYWAHESPVIFVFPTWEGKLPLAWLNPLLLSYWKRNKDKQTASGLGQYNQKKLPLPFMPQKLGHAGERPATAFEVADKRSFTLNKKCYINNLIQKHILLLENIKTCLSWMNLRQDNSTASPAMHCRVLSLPFLLVQSGLSLTPGYCIREHRYLSVHLISWRCFNNQ